MAIEGVEEWGKKKEHLHDSPDFHLDPNKTMDPVEKLLDELGPTKAFDELVDQLPPDTDKEVVRQMKFILNKVIKQKQH